LSPIRACATPMRSLWTRQVLNPERVSMPDFDFDIDFCLLDALNGWLKPENVEIVYQ